MFHDPAQAIYRDDVVAQLGLIEFPLETNCRNAAPIHAVVSRFAEGGLASEAMRIGRSGARVRGGRGRRRDRRGAADVLHRLRATDSEAVNPWDIAVLTASKLEESAGLVGPGSSVRERGARKPCLR